MKKRNPIYTAGSFLLAGALTLSMAACSAAQTQATAEAAQTAVRRRPQTVSPLLSPLHRPPWCSPLLRRRPLRHCL